MGSVAGGAIGAAFFLWIAGTRALDPEEIGWMMRYDWPIHFFGWHFFRSEPWHWPPGLITAYYAPIGTAIGFTDSIPLVAFLLKPIARWLPATFQYLGAWLLLCFVLQGAFGAWLVRPWTNRISIQSMAAAVFVLMPVLLIRIGHPALCAHWLLLWALVIASRTGAARFRVAEWGGLGLVAGLVHPYLAVMTLAVLAAVAASGEGVGGVRRLRVLAMAVGSTFAGWWASGLFSVSGAGSLATEGLGHYSMNLLAPITPTGWSLVLPDIPRATTGQDYEGFQYLGVGVLMLIATALWAARRPAPGGRARTIGLPVVAVALAMAVYALSPRVTAGPYVLFDLTGPLSERLAIFRATGRFFWPMAYVVVVWTIATVVRQWPSRVALSALVAAVTVQLVDLHGAHEDRRRGARDPAFYAWSHPMTSPLWAKVLPLYDHLVLYPPPQCGGSPVPYEPAAWLAGLHGLTLNAGGVARPDLAAQSRYCHDLGDQIRGGQIDDRTLYVMLASEVEALRASAQPPAVCGEIDSVSVCVTAGSYQRWRDLATLQ
jgi:hypothetical protein